MAGAGGGVNHRDGQITVSADLSIEELVDQIAFNTDFRDVLSFIIALDNRMADVEFTATLADHCLNELRRIGVERVGDGKWKDEHGEVQTISLAETP